MANYNHYQRLSVESASNVAKYTSTDLLNAFLDGALQGINLPRDPYIPQDNEDGRRRYMNELLIEQEVLANARARELAQLVLTRFPIDKNKFRAMLFDCASINDDGNEIDENCQIIDEAEHRPWPHCQFVHRQTGKVISKDQYEKISDPSEKGRYRRVRYYDINGYEHRLRVTEDDFNIVEEAIAQDIANGDAINEKYSDITASPHGPLSRYRSTIVSNIATQPKTAMTFDTKTKDSGYCRKNN